MQSRSSFHGKTLETTLPAAYAPAGSTSHLLSLNFKKQTEERDVNGCSARFNTPAKKSPRLKLDIRSFAKGLVDQIANRDSRLRDRPP